MVSRTIDIGTEFKRGWKVMQDNLGLMLLTGLIGTALAGTTCGVLQGPMLAGVLLICQRLLAGTGDQPEVADIFKGFDYFLQVFICCVIFQILPFFLLCLCLLVPPLGVPLLMIVSVATFPLLIWCLMFIVFGKLSALDAFKRVFEGLSSGEMVRPLLMGLLAGIVYSAGNALCFGTIFTLPFACAIMASTYATAYGSAVGAGRPPTLP